MPDINDNRCPWCEDEALNAPSDRRFNSQGVLDTVCDGCEKPIRVREQSWVYYSVEKLPERTASMKDEVNALAKLARIRNRLEMARTLQVELREAAKRVLRLSQAGTPERLVTLMAVADETGLSIGDIGAALHEATRKPRKPSRTA